MGILHTLLVLLAAVVAVRCQEKFVNLKHYSTGQIDIDTIVFVGDEIPLPGTTVPQIYPELYQKLNDLEKLDQSFMDHPSVHYIKTNGKLNKLIFSPTGNLECDTADGRTIYDATWNAFKLAHQSGSKEFLLVLGDMKKAEKEPWGMPKQKYLNAILGALYALYVPIEIRDLKVAARSSKYTMLHIAGEAEIVSWAIKYGEAIEQGRWIARDICGSDPERMSASKIIEYINEQFNTGGVTVSTSDILEEEYPLMAAVNRASKDIKRHNGKVVKMNYNEGGGKEVLFLIGKGITLDTGGMDLKVKGAMVGMHRDKCGAAAVVGFMKTIELLKDKEYDVRAKLAFVRNNIGAKAYTLDEIIMSRAGKRIRIVNTDAEGRMVMVDLITEAKEEALMLGKDTPSQIFTVATLTGHVQRCYKYMIGAMENGPSKQAKVLEKMQASADKTSDLLEISTLRKEDYDFNVGTMETEDYIQANNKPSTATDRGHQYPAAFLMQASGLIDNGRNMGNTELKFIHLDVAGSALGDYDLPPTASPLTMLASHYLVKE